MGQSNIYFACCLIQGGGAAFWRQRDGKQWGGPVKNTVKLFQGKLTLKWSREDLGRVEWGKARSSTRYVLSRFSGHPEGEHPASRQAVKTLAARWDWAIAKLTPREAARTYETQLWKRGRKKKENMLQISVLWVSHMQRLEHCISAVCFTYLCKMATQAAVWKLGGILVSAHVFVCYCIRSLIFSLPYIYALTVSTKQFGLCILVLESEPCSFRSFWPTLFCSSLNIASYMTNRLHNVVPFLIFTLLFNKCKSNESISQLFPKHSTKTMGVHTLVVWFSWVFLVSTKKEITHLYIMHIHLKEPILIELNLPNVNMP